MTVRRIRGPFLVVTLLALVGLVFGVIPSERTIHIYLAFVVALAAYAAVSDTLRRFDSPQRLRRRLRLRIRPHSVPPYFERVVRTIELASMTSAQYEPVRRRLRLIAEQRLGARGVLLESDRAQELLGVDGCTLLQEIPHERRFERGPRPRQLRELIERLEQV